MTVGADFSTIVTGGELSKAGVHAPSVLLARLNNEVEVTVTVSVSVDWPGSTIVKVWVTVETTSVVVDGPDAVTVCMSVVVANIVETPCDEVLETR